MKKYIAYYRVSTKKQCLGLEAQRTTVSTYINNVQDSILLNEYEEKESGKYDNRTQLNKALFECKQQNATLIIAKLDRLSRNVSFIFALRDANVDFIACDLPEFNTLTLAIFSALAQQERELISSRTKAALAEKKKTKQLGTPANLTNNLDKAIENSIQTRRNKALLNDNNRKAYTLIKALKEANNSFNAIAKQLNENGFRTANNCEFKANQVERLYHLFNV